MANLIRINNFSNKYSENLINKKSSFNSSNTINVTTGTATLQSSTTDAYRGSFLSILNQQYNSVDLNFNISDALTTPVTKNGLYIFQMSIYTSTPTLGDVNFGVKIYKDGVYDSTINGIYSQLYSYPQIGTTITFAQTIECFDITQLDFSFVVYKNTSFPTANFNFNIGNFKVEYDVKSLSIPTNYTAPFDYYTNPYTGWGYYVDSLATPTITIGTSYTQITIDALGSNQLAYLPKEIRGISQLFSANKITPIAIGDDYDGRFDCTVTAKTGTPTFIELIIDISGSTAGTNPAFTGYIQTGGSLPYNQSMPLDYYALGTFLANGGKLYAKVDSGTVTIGRRNIKVTRKSKAF